MKMKTVRVKVNQDGSIKLVSGLKADHRQVTNADYSFDEIKRMMTDGWRVTSCQLQRTVECDAEVVEEQAA